MNGQIKNILCALSLFALWSFTNGALADSPADGESACVPTGRWLAPASARTLDESRLIDDMARRPVVLLGEAHVSAEHHRWQLHVLAALHARQPNMVIGFEAFPRSVQPVLDRWARGDIGEKEFLEESRWNDVWRYAPELYMPLFHFARMNRIPIRALNIERARLGPISQGGWAAAAQDLRDDIGDPAPASQAYKNKLKEIFGEHSNGKDEKKEDEGAFQRFVDVQLTWDRAMARELARVRTAGGAPLVVAIAGRGHVEYGFGIPHQLDDLGVPGSAVLLPWDRELPCDDLNTDGGPVAHAVFGIDAPSHPIKPPKPMLGVQIENIGENGSGGVRIVRVIENSVAAKAGIDADDIIIEAAGFAVADTRALVAIIQRQAPGTWLPLKIRRGGAEQDLIARFPAKPEKPAHP